MNIVCFNPGSGTLRYRLFAMDRDEQELTGGMVDRIKGAEEVADAASDILQELSEHSFDALAVRTVHGGPKLVHPTRVDDQVIDELRKWTHLAPLHLPTDIAVLDAVRQRFRGPTYAVFDTLFHRNLPDTRRYFPLPDGVRERYPRFGFHGFAHESVSVNFREQARSIGHLGSTERLISIHFGGGASACAIRDGQSIATTMGMTPVDGLMMSSRSGSIDPGLVLALIRDGASVDEVDELLNRKSGLLGVSGISDDTRDILPKLRDGNQRAKLAIEMYADRVRQAIGGYIAILGGCDAVLISGALVKESPLFRVKVLGGLECFGICLDDKANANEDELKGPTRLDDGPTTVAFLPADEELQMARAVHVQREEKTA